LAPSRAAQQARCRRYLATASRQQPPVELDIEATRGFIGRRGHVFYVIPNSAEAMRHQQAEVRLILDNQDALGRISLIPFELL